MSSGRTFTWITFILTELRLRVSANLSSENRNFFVGFRNQTAIKKSGQGPPFMAA
jgi:hypothetical protein